MSNEKEILLFHVDNEIKKLVINKEEFNALCDVAYCWRCFSTCNYHYSINFNCDGVRRLICISWRDYIFEIIRSLEKSEFMIAMDKDIYDLSNCLNSIWRVMNNRFKIKSPLGYKILVDGYEIFCPVRIINTVEQITNIFDLICQNDTAVFISIIQKLYDVKEIDTLKDSYQKIQPYIKNIHFVGEDYLKMIPNILRGEE